MDTESVLLLMVDIQEKLFAQMQQPELLLENCVKLLRATSLLDISLMVSEQYPQGLGKTLPELQRVCDNRLHSHFSKTTFSCLGQLECQRLVTASQAQTVIVFGIEAHICVMQTVLGFLAQGKTTYFVADCLSSRKALDKEMAMQRMIQAGARPSSMESIVFELFADASHPQFRAMLQIIKS